MMSNEAGDSPIKAVRWIDKTAIVDAVGDIDLTKSPQFQQALLALLDKKPERLVVNLSQVGYMDSSGVASLVKVLSRVRGQNVSLHLAAMSPRVRNLFEITRLDSVFNIHATEEEALA